MKIDLREVKPTAIEVAVNGSTVMVDPYKVARSASRCTMSDDLNASLDNIKSALEMPDISDSQAIYLFRMCSSVIKDDIEGKGDGPVQQN